MHASCMLPMSAGPSSHAELRQTRALLYESMRFKPVGPVAIRTACEDMHIPLTSAPGGRLHVRKGQAVVINLASMHRDPQVGRRHGNNACIHASFVQAVDGCTLPFADAPGWALPRVQ